MPYTVTTSGREDIPTDLADGFSFAGRWIISFGSRRHYTGERQDVGVVVMRSYEVNDNEVTIIDGAGLRPVPTRRRRPSKGKISPLEPTNGH